MPRLLLAALVVACLAVNTAPARSAPPIDTGPLVVTSGAGDGVHRLVPGTTFVWPVAVTVRVDRLDSLLGALSVAGGLADSDDITAQIVSCPAAWVSGRCIAGEFSVLATTPLDRLPHARAPLQAPPQPRPGTTYLQVRLLLASDARLAGATDLTAVLRVDASGPDGPIASGSTRSISSLADTGSTLTGYGGLAVAAVGAGLLLAGGAALAQRRRRTRA